MFFNTKKIKGICELCKEEIGNEVHHLQHQKNANELIYMKNKQCQ